MANASQNRAFTYDGRGFLLSETHPEKGVSGNGTTLYQTTSGSTITDGYDARGHAHRRIDGSVDGPFDLSFLYDTAERLITVEDPDPASNSSPKARRTLKQFTFATANAPANCSDTSAGACDARNGKLLSGVRHNYLPALGDLTVTDTWQYTGLGGRSSQRDTSVASGTGFSGGAFRASQTWNDLGLVGVLNYPARCTGVNCSMPDQRSVTNTYLNGFLTGVTGFASGISYQPNGLIDTVVHGNGVSETWIPDPNGMTRPCAIFTYSTGVSLLSNTGGSDPACSHSLAGGPGNAVKFGSGAYAFDASGNIKAIGAKGYTYDGVSRFTAATNGESVVYDVYGNITNHTGQSGNVDSTTNRLTTATYDDAGNVTAINTDTSSQTSTWDALSMMQRFRIFATGPHTVPGNSLSDSSYLYDPDDERIAVIANASGDFVFSPRSVTTYTLRAFDPHLLRSYTDDPRLLDNPQPPNSEVWTVKEDEIWRGSQLLALATGDGYVAHYTLDHLGSPATITDSDGLGSTPTFDPFGTGGVNFGALQFTGHERDQGAGLDYMHARFYSANAARFLSVDPFRGTTRLPQSWSRYAYVQGNPITFIDPTGKDTTAPRDDACSGDAVGPCYTFVDVPPKEKARPPSDAAMGLTEAQYAKGVVRSMLAEGKYWASGFRRRPDYITVTINVAIPNQVTLTLLGPSGQVTFDRWGRVYLSLGLGFGKSATGVSGTATAGWLSDRATSSQVENFITGWGANFGGGVGGGGGITWGGPGNGLAAEVGVFSPQVGVSAGYTWETSLDGIHW